MKKLMKLLVALVTLVGVLLSAWIFLSWVDIVADNNSPNPEHSTYNFFDLPNWGSEV